jgi:hypothetical protein
MRPAAPRITEPRTPTPGRSVTRDAFVYTLRTGPASTCGRALSPDQGRRSTCRCARGSASLPQGSLAPARVLLSRTLLAYSDPIRQSREHAATSRPRRLYATPSLCGSASATRGTFPTFTAVLSRRAVDHTPVGPRGCPVARTPLDTRLPRFVPESPPTRSRLCQQHSAGIYYFDAASFALCCGPSVCQALLTGSDSRGVTCAPPSLLRTVSLPLFARPVAGLRWESG